MCSCRWRTRGNKEGKRRQCCRKEKAGRRRKGGPGTQRQRNTHSCRVSTPISLYCSSCFTWASSCFSLESCRHTRPNTRLAWHTMGFSHHRHPTELLSHDYSHTGMQRCVCTGTHVHAHTHTHSHTKFHILRKSCLMRENKIT